jgi:hypothetical protein
VKVSEFGNFSGPVKMPSEVLKEFMSITSIGPIASNAKNIRYRWTLKFFDLFRNLPSW